MTALNLKKGPGDRLAFPAPYEPYGLTKRELFAAMAMQGFIASADYQHFMLNNGYQREGVATSCVLIADALLAELAKDGAP